MNSENNNSWTAVARKVQAQVPNVSKAELTFKSNSPRFSDLDKKTSGGIIMDAISDVSEIHYGIDRTRISMALINTCIDSILAQFSHLTKDDLYFAFERARIEANQFTRLTINELINPITRWNVLKIRINNARRDVNRELNENEIAKKKEQEFLERCKDVYRDSLKEGIWKGDPFFATGIYKYFLDEFNEDQILIMKQEGRNIYAKLKEAAEDKRNPFHVAGLLFTTPERYYYETVVKTAIELGIEKF